MNQQSHVDAYEQSHTEAGDLVNIGSRSRASWSLKLILDSVSHAVETDFGSSRSHHSKLDFVGLALLLVARTVKRGTKGL